MSVHHKDCMNDMTVFGDVDDVVAVAHVFRTETEQTVFGFAEIVCRPEFTQDSLTVMVAHNRCPRNTVGINLPD